MYCYYCLLLGPIGVHSALHSYTPQHIAFFWLHRFFYFYWLWKKAFKLERCSCACCIRFFLCNSLLINTGQQYVTAVASSIYLFRYLPLLFQLCFLRNKQTMVMYFIGTLRRRVGGHHGFGVPSPYSLLIVLAARGFILIYIKNLL